MAQQVCKIPFDLAVPHLEVYPKESIRNAHVEMVEMAGPRLPWTSCPKAQWMSQLLSLEVARDKELTKAVEPKVIQPRHSRVRS